MVIAGELNDADNKVLIVMVEIENQKLFWTKQQRAVKGKAKKLLRIQILDFAVKFSFVSRRSLRIPLSIFDIKPPKAKENAFRIEYYVLY